MFMTKKSFAKSGILSKFNRYLYGSVSTMPDPLIIDFASSYYTSLSFEDGAEFATIYHDAPRAGEQLPDWRRKHDLQPRLR